MTSEQGKGRYDSPDDALLEVQRYLMRATDFLSFLPWVSLALTELVTNSYELYSMILT